jgi:hypothetical protein
MRSPTAIGGWHAFSPYDNMKKIIFIYSAILCLMVVCKSVSAQTLLLDSLKGTWSMSEHYNNKSRIDPKGTIKFLEDGTFKSDGSYFGTAVGFYRTDESKSTIQIEINGVTSEWTASIRNHVLRMIRPRRKKAPRIELVLFSEKAEFNSSGN